MTIKGLFLTVFLGSCFLLFGCSARQDIGNASPSNDLMNIDIEPIARIASNEVGVVGKISKGTKGAAILFLEERHTSRAGQIELAIALVRLHDLNGLKHIGLEGYLKDDPKIETEWFKKGAHGDPMTKVRVAVRLLKEGEISAAEFMALVYEDIVLHPIEVRAEYSVEISEVEGRAPLLYLLKIAQKSLRSEHALKLQQFQEQINSLRGEAKQAKVKEMLDYVLSTDPWAQEKAKIFLDPKVAGSMSAESLIAAGKEIKARAQSLSVPISSDEEKAMQGFIEFYEGRGKASQTMLSSTEEFADQQNVSLVALNIGAAHTDGMTKMASAANRTFAVVTPLSLNKDEVAGDLTLEMYDRKQHKLSVYSEGFMDTILKAFPDSKQNQKKEPSVLMEPWLQAKSELFLFTDRITRGVLVPTTPPGGGKPPYGFSDDDFNGKWLFIDPKLISIIPDDTDAKKRAVLFPVILNYKNPQSRTEMWVKAGLVTDNNGKLIPDDANESIESRLKEALREVKNQNAPGEVPSKKAEDKTGRVQITLNTLAAYGSSQEAVKKVSVTKI